MVRGSAICRAKNGLIGSRKGFLMVFVLLLYDSLTDVFPDCRPFIFAGSATDCARQLMDLFGYLAISVICFLLCIRGSEGIAGNVV